MQSKLSNTKGITLIALVITIVVIIILAGVAINMTLGENGIFTKAKYAKEQYEKAAVKEKLNLAILEIQTEEINNGELTLDKMLISLQEKLPEITITKDGETLKGSLDGYDFVIGSDFKVIIEGYNEEAGNGGTQEPEVATYTVTFNGENVTSSGVNTVQENASYTTILTPAEGYEIVTVEVKMGDTTLTGGTHYTYEKGTITIASVTGNLTITVTTEVIVSVTELTSYDQEGTLLSYSWEELEEVANVISNNPSIITNDSMGARVTIGANTYEVKVGNLVEVTYNNEVDPYKVKIVGFNHDTLASDTTKTAGISFVFEDVLFKQTMADNDGGTTNNDGWTTRAIRETLNGTTKGLLSNSEQIKEVQKTYLLGNQSTDNTNKTSDYLWLLSCSEIWTQPRSGDSSVVGLAAGTEGEQYKYYKEIIGNTDAGTGNDKLIKTENSSTSAANWWLRSPYYDNSGIFCSVYTTGICGGNSASNSYGVVPGFAI